MSRALDNWSTYYDRENNPLYGRIWFYKLHTTELQPIYNEDGTVPLQNPMPTSQYGITDVQVFLQDTDYTIKLEKWTGRGAMMTVDDPNDEDWAEVRTFDNLYPAILVDNPEGVVNSVELSSINALRQVDVSSGSSVNYAKVTGYYTMGDMPVQYYKLVEDSSPMIVDDGGSIIKPEHSTNKYWMLIPQENIDVRVFGIFPSVTASEIESQTSDIHACFAYANKQGKDVYFPQVYDTTAFYFVEGGSHTISQKMVVDRGVHIVAKPLTTSTLNIREIQYYGSQLFYSTGSYGMLTVNCPVVRTSWKCNGWANWPGSVQKFIVDTLDTSFSFSNARVEFENTVSNRHIAFNNCYIVSDHRMDSCSVEFTNCGYITDLWLTGTYTVSLLIGNIIELSEMSSANVYVNWKNKQNEANYGDLGEQTISNVALLSGAVAENAYFTNVNLMGSAELHNISGTVSISADSAQNWIDCWLTITNAATVPSFALRRGKVSGASTMVVHGSVYLENVEQDIPLDVRGGNLTILNSSIDKPISHVGSPVVEKIMNCTFNSRISITGGATNAIVNSTWVNNFGNVDRPIYIDRSNLNPVDLAHTYRYENNSGTFYPSKEVEWSETLTYTKPTTADPYTISSTNGRFALGIPNGSEDFKNIFFATYKFADPTTQLQYAPPHGFATKVKLFRVGTDSCNAIVTWNVVSSMFNGSTWGRCLETVIPIVAQMRFVHDSNDDYHVYIREDGSFSQGGNNYYTYPFALWRLSAEADWTGLTITGKFLARKL